MNCLAGSRDAVSVVYARLKFLADACQDRYCIETGRSRLPGREQNAVLSRRARACPSPCRVGAFTGIASRPGGLAYRGESKTLSSPVGRGPVPRRAGRVYRYCIETRRSLLPGREQNAALSRRARACLSPCRAGALTGIASRPGGLSYRGESRPGGLSYQEPSSWKTPVHRDIRAV